MGAQAAHEAHSRAVQHAAQQQLRKEQQQLQQQQQQAKQQRSIAQQQTQNRNERQPCPQTGWQYVDPKGNIQGPFTLVEMNLWNSIGYFRPDLPMRCDPGDAFVEINKLFPPPSIPFESYPI